MTAQLRQQEKATKGIRRIVRKQIRKTLESLGDDHRISDEMVHGARKSLKKIRAALRLLREQLGSRAYHDENACFRDAARPLTELRDAQVLIDTLDKLSSQCSGELEPAALGVLRRALKEHRRQVRQQTLLDREALKPVREALERAQCRWDNCSPPGRGWSVLGAGLKRVYDNARTAFTLAQQTPSVENLHEWRKQVKYLWHELQFLQPLWPTVLKDLADQMHELTTRLGDDHDLAVLRQQLQVEAESFHDGTTVAALVRCINCQQAALRQQAAQLGGRLFEERPGQFVRRLQGYWQLWRAEGRSPAAVTSSHNS